MKKVIFGILCLFLTSQVFVSCSSESDVLSQFSKRKYMKNFKHKKVKHKDNIDKYEDDVNYTASVEQFNYQLEEIEAKDNSTMVE